MSQASLYYRHSGAIGAPGIPLMALLGLVAALVGGAVYGYLIFYIPFIYLNFFITIGFGGLVGYLVGTGAKLGRVRNNLVTGSAAFVSVRRSTSTHEPPVPSASPLHDEEDGDAETRSIAGGVAAADPPVGVVFRDCREVLRAA